MSRAVVFIHGFLGTGDDWLPVREVIEKQTPMQTFAPTLPGHHESSARDVPKSLSAMADWLAQYLTSIEAERIILAGYSLGGRIAMVLSKKLQELSANDALFYRINGLIVESSHLGLPANQCPDRWQNDLAWAERFRSEVLCDVLEDWYRQKVFLDLSKQERSKLIMQRSIHNPEKLADVLVSCSLANQAPVYSLLKKPPFPIHYWFGERDQKFVELAKSLSEQYQVSCYGFKDAGHNCHISNPGQYARKVMDLASSLFQS